MTYAIFKASGFQYRAELGDVLRLPTQDAEAGEVLTFDEVLLGSNDGEVLVGRPTVEDASVRAEVLGHGRADKVIVFKFKRRKNYRRKRGHRQGFTDIRINEIDLGDAGTVSLEEKAKKPAKKKTKKKTAKKKTAKKTEAKTETKKAPAKKKSTKTSAKKEPEPKAKAKSSAKPKGKAKSSSKKKKTSDSKSRKSQGSKSKKKKDS